MCNLSGRHWRRTRDSITHSYVLRPRAADGKKNKDTGREGGRVTTRKRWLVLPTESWALQLCSHVVVCKFIQSTLSVFDGNSILFRGVRAVRGGGDELIKRWEVSVPRWWFFISRPLSLSRTTSTSDSNPRCQDGRRSSPSPFHPPSLSLPRFRTLNLFFSFGTRVRFFQRPASLPVRPPLSAKNFFFVPVFVSTFPYFVMEKESFCFSAGKAHISLVYV